MDDTALGLAHAVMEMMGGEHHANYLTFLDRHYGFFYIAVPGAANFRTPGSLQMGVAHMRGRAHHISDPGMVFDRPHGLLANPNQAGFQSFGEMLEDDTVIKLAFLRDPVDRFASAYRSQYAFNRKKTKHRRKLFDFLGMPDEENLSMLDLAELMTEEGEIKTLSPQLMPQRRLIAYDLVHYDFIGRHETWADDYSRIAMEIFECETPVFDPIKSLGKDPENSSLRVLVDEETRAVLAKAYEEDFEMLAEIKELFPDGFAVE